MARNLESVSCLTLGPGDSYSMGDTTVEGNPDGCLRVTSPEGWSGKRTTRTMQGPRCTIGEDVRTPNGEIGHAVTIFEARPEPI